MKQAKWNVVTNWTSEEATRELLSVLPFLNRLVAAELRHEAGEETTMSQFRVLAYLMDSPLTLSGLAKKRRVSLQSAGELVQGLVERGWIVRMPDPNDRRQSMLHLTDAGRAEYLRAQEAMIRHLVPFLDTLTPAEMSAVQIALPALRRALSGDEGNE